MEKLELNVIFENGEPLAKLPEKWIKRMKFEPEDSKGIMIFDGSSISIHKKGNIDSFMFSAQKGTSQNIYLIRTASKTKPGCVISVKYRSTFFDFVINAPIPACDWEDCAEYVKDYRFFENMDDWIRFEKIEVQKLDESEF